MELIFKNKQKKSITEELQIVRHRYPSAVRFVAMEIIVVWRKSGYVWMCVVKELCWFSVQGCAQDCYI